MEERCRVKWNRIIISLTDYFPLAIAAGQLIAAINVMQDEE